MAAIFSSGELDSLRENESKFIKRMENLINSLPFSMRADLARKFLPNWLLFNNLSGKVYYFPGVSSSAEIASKKEN